MPAPNNEDDAGTALDAFEPSGEDTGTALDTFLAKHQGLPIRMRATKHAVVVVLGDEMEDEKTLMVTGSVPSETLLRAFRRWESEP